jgi:hypothetical protein
MMMVLLPWISQSIAVRVNGTPTTGKLCSRRRRSRTSTAGEVCDQLAAGSALLLLTEESIRELLINVAEHAGSK